MLYCPPNVTLSDVWVNHGFSICFFDTVTASVIGGFILIFGLVQLRLYKKYATRLENATIPQNFLFKLQILSHLALISLSLLNIVIRHTVYDNSIYGYEVLDVVSALVTWSLCLAVLLIERHYQLPSPPGHGHGAVLLLTWSLAFVSENLDLLSLNNQDWFFNLEDSKDKFEFTFFVLRYIFTFVIFVLGIRAPGISQARDYLRPEDEESILPQANPGGNSSGSTWRGFFKKLGVLLPYLWPKNSIALQFRVLLCLLLLAGVRVVNVFVPIFYKKIVDAFTPSASSVTVDFCWQLILAFVALKWFQGGGTFGQGLLNTSRSYLWIPVQQYTTREIQVSLFQHLHNLSLRWHLSRKTGEVLRVMDRGTNSINSLLQYLIFNILPTLIDITIACIYFTAMFNAWFGLIVFVTMAIYIALTVSITEWRTKYRRQMNLADNEQRTRSVDSLLNFETVKYYGAVEFEINRYKTAILDYQKEEWKSLASLTMLNMTQSVVINLGLLSGSLYCGFLISEGKLTVGDYVLFGTYMMQLMAPLSFLGSSYRFIQESFINMENMFDLMEEPQEVKDRPNALPIVATQGHIEFRNVNFHYSPERQILKNISFVVEPGQTVALVGPTGSGKSTVIRLLFRFYDVNDGEILIDHQDLQNVTQASVRKAIGVVPQDTVLFNETIQYNIGYGQQDSPESAIHTAARHADIHDKILTFPESYETKVGERGLKLSGGEKQRVAIARTILKAPLVVLLDEATSALDTQTERNIQNALTKVCQNRTTLIVAHRLSTITHADCILVLQDGEIIERGRHEELLEVGGKYSDMWTEQSKAQGKAQNKPKEDETTVVQIES